jgi:two-component system LytT family response regulator
MTMRALIVDDEPLARRRLRTLLRAEPDVTVVGEAEDGVAAVGAITALRPDLVFLDVQMPGLDGFGVLDEIGLARAPAVIFVTAYDRYALEAFDAHAVDYLLKPFDRGRLRDAIARAARLAGHDDLLQRIHALLESASARRPLRRLLVRSEGRIHFVNVAEIDWVERAGHYAVVHAGRATHVVRETIAALAARLDPDRFARIGRGTVVNLDAVRELQSASHGDLDVVLKNGTRLRASRRYAQALRRGSA